jgi:Macrocin-O-methyltransferase (TylF)
MRLPRALVHSAASFVYRTARLVAPRAYAQDGLISMHNHDFMNDESFVRAYASGLRALDGVADYSWHWRVHIGLWAATTAAHLPGDFIECGVNRGFMSSAIMERLDWDRQDRTFWLLDTFAGLDERFVTDGERRTGALQKNREKLASRFYVSDPREIIAKLQTWRNTQVVVGPVPDTLPQVKSGSIAYLHLDMNCAVPEVAAVDYFWERLVPGAVVLFDDYAYLGFESQKVALDAFATRRGVSICSLPTGQGILIVPPPS